MDNKEKGPEAGSTSPRLKAFQATSWAFLVFLYLFSPATSLLLGWFVDFEDNISHRVHEVTFGALFTLVIVGIAAQLRSPARNIAGIQQAIVVTVTFTAVVAASTGWEWTALLYVGPAVAIGVLHPERSQVFRVRLRFERRLRNLMLLATPGFLFSFADEFAKAADGVRDHTTHWGAMAAFALATLLIGYLAASRQPGWLLSAWSVAAASTVYAVASNAFRFDASARPDLRAFILLVWAIVFVVAAERSRAGKARSEPTGIRLRISRAARTIGRWVAIPVLFVPRLLARWWNLDEPSSDGPKARLRDRKDGVGVAARIGIVAGLLLLGAMVYESARTAIAPPVPHTIESQFTSSCVQCHATGLESAPVIDPFTHNNYDSEPRLTIASCGSCHDVPPITSSDAVPPDEHPAIAPLSTADLELIASWAAR